MPIIRLAARVYVYFDLHADYFDGFSYVKLNKILLTLLGLWPYSKQITKRCNYTVFVVWTLWSSTLLLEGLMEMQTWDTVMFYGTIAVILWILSSLILATTFLVQASSLRKLYDQMECDYKAIKDVEEKTIMRTFTRRATVMTGTYSAFAFIAALVFLFANFLPSAYRTPSEYSTIFSTYSKRWIIHEDVHQLQVVVHSALIICYAGLLYITVLNMYLYSIKHTCGLFAIVSYRLQKIMKSNDNTEKIDKVIPELLDLITKHKEAIRCSHIVGQTFNTSLYIIQVLGLIYTAVLSFGIQLSFNYKSIHLVFRAFPMTAVIAYYGFYLNYGGQQIIEFSSKVFADTWYFSGWESMPTKARKIVLMLMLRSSRSCTLRAGLMTLSLQNFSRLAQVSWSMATVLSSAQKKGHV